jgi:hypothetical protein
MGEKTKGWKSMDRKMGQDKARADGKTHRKHVGETIMHKMGKQG